MAHDYSGMFELIEAHGARFLDLKYTDLMGRLRHVTLPTTKLSSDLLRDGVGIDGSSVGGFSRVEFSDLRIVPDPTAAWLDSFWSEPTVSVLCNVVTAGGKPYPFDPRGVARRAEDHLASTGIADVSLWAAEPEFYLFESVDYQCGDTGSYYRIGDAAGAHGYLPVAGGGYHVALPADLYADARSEMVLTLEGMGVPIKYHHGENGVPGQSEIEPRLLPLLRAADAVVLIKYVVKNVARRYGLTATFMPRPLSGEAGNGMHMHQLLLRGDEPLFYGADGYAGLSLTAMQYLGGLLRHSPSLTGLVAPSTNSYRRLVPGFEAPTAIAFAEGNRTACVRIPAYASSPGAKRLEYRPPDPACNPYLAMSALLMAGLDGIRRKVDPGAEGYGPFDVNIYELPEVRSLPGSLDRALVELETDHGYLVDGGVFCPELLAAWIETKRRTELAALDSRPHPFEFVMYYDC